jgi:hypothetical protein
MMSMILGGEIKATQGDKVRDEDRGGRLELDSLKDI